MGSVVFSRILGLTIPYTGSIKAHVELLEPGHAIVFMKDRRCVRNHLDSIHAIALANLAELSTGLAMIRRKRAVRCELSAFAKYLRGRVDSKLPSIQKLQITQGR